MVHVHSSGKGGTGKSTGALATSGCLAQAYRVAFVDLDPEAYATMMGLGQSASTDPLTAAPIRISHPLLERGQLWLYPGGEAMADASEADVMAHLARCAADADIVVIDTPPDRRHPAVRAALRAASVIVVPIVPEYQALAGMEKLLHTCRELQISAPVRALLSRWEAKTVLARDVHRDLITAHPTAALSVAIPKDQRAAEAPAAGLPVTLTSPSSACSEAYRTVTYQIAASGGLVIPKGAF